MNSLKDLLVKEEMRLAKIVSHVQKELVHAPQGSLRICNGRNNPQYYHCIEGITKENGRYISQKDQELIRQLAQKRYDEKILKVAERRLNQIKRITKDYQDDEIEQIYLRESLERQSIICPIEPIWDDFVKQWEQQPYSGKGFSEGYVEIYTEKGERVRSKTEKILADYFFRNNIPYKYEFPLQLLSYGTVYPDFTLLSRRKRRMIYWEHLGKMDDPDYCRKAVKKIKTYEKNGIIIGENLIITYETSNLILNTKDIEMYVNRYIL